MNLPRRLRDAVNGPVTKIAAVSAALAAATMAPAAAAQDTTPPAGCQGTPTATWINVVAEGLRNGDGLLAVTLYADNPRKFLVRNGSLDVTRFDATAGSTGACIFLPQPGTYAIAVYHDEDSSRRLNRSGIGLPTEGFGFSNNASTIAGLPAFRAVRLAVPRTGLTTRIKIRYP